jgi:SAM-dependent methyltransferase
MSLRNFIEKQHSFDLFRPFLLSDHSRQATAKCFAREAVRYLSGAGKILDLGCGEGDSTAFFSEIDPNADWFGVDIEDSLEVRARRQTDGTVATFDGTNLPFCDGAFDLIYSHQVFEHVRRPDELLRDVARVLGPGGLFVDSVSYLEPYHSYSIFNFTPYGVMRVFEDAGLELVELRPDIDGPTLMTRQIFERARLFQAFFRRSPGTTQIGALGRMLGLQHQHINFLKLQFSGQICFLARRAVPDRQGA